MTPPTLPFLVYVMNLVLAATGGLQIHQYFTRQKTEAHGDQMAHKMKHGGILDNSPKSIPISQEVAMQGDANPLNLNSTAQDSLEETLITEMARLAETVEMADTASNVIKNTTTKHNSHDLEEHGPEQIIDISSTINDAEAVTEPQGPPQGHPSIGHTWNKNVFEIEALVHHLNDQHQDILDDSINLGSQWSTQSCSMPANQGREQIQQLFGAACTSDPVSPEIIKTTAISDTKLQPTEEGFAVAATGRYCGTQSDEQDVNNKNGPEYILNTINSSLLAAVKALSWQSHKLEIQVDLIHMLAQVF